MPPDLPRFLLFEGPSPLHPLPRFSAALGGNVEVWIKREDLLPVGLGGNKLRNLEYLIGAALAEGADTLVTSGRRWSNHARLTAAAGAMAGLAVDLILSGPPVEPPGPGIRLAQTFGATVHQLVTADRGEREATVERVLADLRTTGRRPYLIPVGGSGMPGVLGQLDAAIEFGDQVDDMPGDLLPAAVYLPSATGGTQAGLIARTWSSGDAERVIGVLVAGPEAELRPAVRGMLDHLRPWLAADVPDNAIDFDASQSGEGYGRPTAAAGEAAALLARTEGILVDPIYTAKALAALVAGVRSGRHDGRTIVFWHAGGIPGLFEPLDP